MKKRTLFTFIFAVALIIVSGLSSLFLSRQLAAERVENTIKKNYQYDNSEELVINVEDNVALDLSPSSDDSVHLTKEPSSYESMKTDTTDWSIEKKDKQTIITISNKKRMAHSGFSLIYLNDYYNNSVFLNLPKNYKKVTVNAPSADIHAGNFQLKNLTLSTNNGDISVGDSKLENLTIKNANGEAQLYKTTITDKASIDASSGSVYVAETTFSELSTQQESGDLSIDNTKGNVTATVENGSISVNENKGSAKLTTTNGDIDYLANKTYADVTLKSTLGHIEMGISQEIYKKAKVDLSTGLGGLFLFDESLDGKTTYSKTTGANTIKATTVNGDISLYDYNGTDFYDGDDCNMEFEDF